MMFQARWREASCEGQEVIGVNWLSHSVYVSNQRQDLPFPDSNFAIWPECRIPQSPLIHFLVNSLSQCFWELFS